EAEDRAFLAVKQARERDRVDARHRHEGADAVNDERAQQEQQATAHLGVTCDVTDRERRISSRGCHVRLPALRPPCPLRSCRRPSRSPRGRPWWRPPTGPAASPCASIPLKG